MHASRPPSGSPLTELYRNNHRWLINWLRSRTGCSELSADLAQDTFLRILKNEDSIGSIREPRSYLATIARRMMIDHFRRDRLERAWLQVLSEQPEHYAISPEEQTLLLETLQALDSMLAGLGRQVRQTFILSQLEGLPYQRIAETLGISLATVNRNMAKAAQHCMLYALQAEEH
ncbi:sigma-70 family RNA polymerase sigma factor [Pseudomonas sp. ABC1]|uniref:sigma-70 family RNA polymerase sigma factor n=1 Tax=Pseudomonas sp. ABC1 TaxID=2748080 RepID=UPI0015C3D64A|nr:sigma-70 family RNA polymerase sigma factor [Pseudomonas sp. ABC1]QLF91966.1 sigma-70 family RNA polymerase sigma factor [Pseudomonas sp. ABC1]